MMMPNLNELLSLRDVVSPDAPTALYCRLSVDDANEGDSGIAVRTATPTTRFMWMTGIPGPRLKDRRSSR